MKAFGRVFAAVCLVAAPVHAGFDYVPVESDRAMFIHAPADRLGIAQVAARIAPAELQLRWDRRVGAGRIGKRREGPSGSQMSFQRRKPNRLNNKTTTQ